MSDRFDKFTERARRVLQLAQEEAQRFNHNYIGTEHILLGLIREYDGVAGRVLNNMGVELPDVRARVEAAIGSSERIVRGEIGLTPRAKRIIELAVDESRRLNHHYIGTEHLLLGLVRLGEGTAAEVLDSLGFSLEKVRAQVIEVLKSSSSRFSSSGHFAGHGEVADLFSWFTEAGQRAQQYAQEEAQLLGHMHIGTEHLLLGLLRTRGIASQVLGDLGMTLDEARAAVEALSNHKGGNLWDKADEKSVTDETKGAIQAAVQEARDLGHTYIDTEHLLLGALRDGSGIIIDVLKSFNLTLDVVRARIIGLMPTAGGQSEPGGGPISEQEGRWFSGSSPAAQGRQRRFDAFTESAREVLQLAQEESHRFNHNYIGTEHILLGLVRQGNGVAARVLSNLGIELTKVRSAVEFIIGRGDRMVMGDIGLTPRAKRVIELAVDEARRLNHNYIGTEHLLLGLVREGEGIAAGILESLGVSLDRTRAQTLRVLEDSQGVEFSSVASGIDPIEHDETWELRHNLGIEMLRTMFDYSIWARDRLLAALKDLPEEKLRQAPESGAYGSIHDTLVHLAVSEWMWVRRCMGESPLKLPKGEDFATLDELIAWWNEEHTVAVKFLAALNDADLAREVTYVGPDNKERTRKVWHMLLQVVNHQTEHRAQIGSMLGQMGVEVPQTDLVVFLSERG
jgi:ATP-dependent Clp protease ATP-binding subunit ClpA